jgi:predicted Zn-dependent protease
VKILGVLLLAASLGAQTAPPGVKSVKALLQLARTQFEQKNAAGALQSLRRARAIAPNSEEVLLAFAEAALAARAPLEAATALHALVRISPTVAQYHYRQGVTLFRLGDTAAAVEALREAERLEPGQSAFLVALGSALNRQGLCAEAKALLLRASSLEPDSADAIAALAEAEAGLGERDAAESHAERVLVLASTHPMANLVLGRLRLDQERYAEARDALLKADPDLPVVHDQLSRAYTRLNDPVRAQRHQELSRQKSRERDDRVQEVRRLTGFSAGEPQP